MAGGVRGLVLHVRPAAGLVPDGIDHPRRQMAGAVDYRRRRQEECWGLGEHLLVGTALLAEIVLDRLGAFLADLVTVALPALLADGDAVLREVDLAEVEVADGGAAHAGLDQAVDDRPVAPRPVALAARPLVGKFDVFAAAAVPGAP